MTRLYLLLLTVLLMGLPSLAHATTLHDAITADATGKNVSVADKGSVGVSITISGTATVTFKGSTDGGTTFDTVSCTVLGGTTTTTTATATGQYTCSVSGFTHFEAPVSGCSSCTVTVKALGQMPSAGGSGGAESSLLTSILASITDVWDTVNHAWKVTLATLISGEDQTNNLLMTSGGAVRYFPIMTNVTTNTTSGNEIVHGGGKTPIALATAAGAFTGTVTFYGDADATTTKGEWICTLILDATTKGVQYCPQFTKDYLYYHAVTTLITGSPTVNAGFVVGVAGSKRVVSKPMVPVTADTLVQTGPGFLECIIFSSTTPPPTAGTISINDATSAGTGTVILAWAPTTADFAPAQVCPMVPYTTGLYIDFTTTNDVSVKLVYQ